MTELFNSDNNDQEQTVDYLAWAKEKYGDDPAAIAKAKYHQDMHLKKVETENQGMREDLNKRITMEEMLAQIKANQHSPVEPNHGSQRESNADQAPAVNYAEIEKLLDQKLSVKEKQDLAKRNVAFVDQELRKAWGPSYQDRLRKEVKALSMDEASAGALAESNPQLFLKAVVGSTSPNRAPEYTPPKSAINSAALGQMNSNVRDNKYYEAIRKSNPAQYWDRATQSQLHKDVAELGPEVFYKS